MANPKPRLEAIRALQRKSIDLGLDKWRIVVRRVGNGKDDNLMVAELVTGEGEQLTIHATESFRPLSDNPAYT